VVLKAPRSSRTPRSKAREAMPEDDRTIDVFLCDLDGVVRLYDEFDTHKVEDTYKLPRGCIERTAFSADLLRQVTTGALSRQEWVATIGNFIGNASAAEAWERRPVATDSRVLAAIAQVKRRGIPVCLVTNGTDNLRAELENLRIDTFFDEIFNSAELGVAKPATAIYEIILSRIGCPASRVAYVDDTGDNISAARALGIRTLQYSNFEQLKAWLTALRIFSPLLP
jgi:HAD superfamily hydrolase (TIGR01509 family)